MIYLNLLRAFPERGAGMKRGLLRFVFLLLAGNALLFGGEAVAEISYLDDPAIKINRGSGIVENVDFGTEIENMDLIQTSKSGTATITTIPSTGIDASITVKPKSSFYVQLSNLQKQQKAGVELLAGSVSVSVKKLAGKSRLDVRTESAVMGVRGTVFDVTTSVSGDILVTCSEGSVECVDEEGKALFAGPGKAVEKLPGERFREIPVKTGDIASFREKWIADRIDAFKPNALRAIRAYAIRYNQLFGKFVQAYNGLMQERVILQKWINEDKRNTIGGRLEIMTEKKAIVGHLMTIRKVLFMFERVYFRVLELSEYHDQGYGRGNIDAGTSSADFFRRVMNDKVTLEQRMQEIRYIMKLYAKRNDGSLPFDDTSSAEEFFDSGDGFFGN